MNSRQFLPCIPLPLGMWSLMISKYVAITLLLIFFGTEKSIDDIDWIDLELISKMFLYCLQ